MTTQEKLIRNKLSFLELAEYLKNVSEACKVNGVSRQHFYDIKKAYEENGLDGLRQKSRRKPCMKNRVAPEIEEAVVRMAYKYPAYGQTRAANELKKQGTLVSSGGIRSIRLRHGLETFKKRLVCLEKKAAEVYRAKIPVTAADTLNDRALPFFEQQSIPVMRVITDRGTEFRGTPDKHPYELYLQLNEIEHTKTKARSPQTNGICERFHQTILNEFYRVIFRKKIYSDLDVLQTDSDEYINHYNHERTHQGKRCQGRTPMQTFIDGKQYFAQKNLDNLAA